MEQVTTRSGRRLAFDVTGARNGYPVFLMHGTPGSRNGPKPRGIVLHRLGLKLICYDRPGYGGSDRQPERSVQDAAHDVVTIADSLGLDQFAMVGRSGGGPHALACAAALPNRVSRTATLVSLAPMNIDSDELNWFQGMNEQNAHAHAPAELDTSSSLAGIRAWAERARENPKEFIALLTTQLSERDKRVTEDVVLRRLLTETYAEALRQGPVGWIDDVLAFHRPWGVDLSRISTPVLLWHGAEDTFSPVGHTRWLGAKIPRAEVQIDSGIGHFGAIEVLPRILAWVVDGLAKARSPGTPIVRPATP